MSSTPSDVIAAFKAASDAFPKFTGPPTDDSLRQIHEAITPILLPIPYDGEDGQDNLMGIILEDSVYKKHYNKKGFKQPTRLPIADTSIDINATTSQVAIATATHAAKRVDFSLYDAAERGVCQFIQQAYDETWYKGLFNPHTMYSKVKAIEFLRHLRENAGGLHAIQAVDIPSTLPAFYVNADTIYDYIIAMEDAQAKSVRADLPITDAFLVASATKATMAAGTFPTATEQWEELIPAQKTWTRWKEHYKKAQKQLDTKRQSEGTTGPFAGLANAAASQQPSDHPISIEQFSNALDNLALASTADQNMQQMMLDKFDSLAASIKTLDTRLETLTTTNKSLAGQLKQKDDRINSLLKKLGEGDSAGASSSPSWWSRGGYCWTHGYGVSKVHSSQTCNNKSEGHKDNATRSNTMGGSQLNKGWDN